MIRGVKKCKRPSVLPASRSQTQTQVPESRNRNPCCWGLAGYAIVLPPNESARSEGQQERFHLAWVMQEIISRMQVVIRVCKSGLI